MAPQVKCLQIYHKLLCKIIMDERQRLLKDTVRITSQIVLEPRKDVNKTE